MTLNEFIARLEGFPARYSSQLDRSMTPVVASIMQQFADRSPLDSSTFRGNWRTTRRTTPTGFRFMITNATPYGIYLDEGGEPGGEPWYWPNANNPSDGGNISNSGKLLLENRVWAGGRSPAGFVTGGIIDPILMNADSRAALLNQNKLMEAAANAVMESI